ncbi:LOW QUALITY PROTEIN: huntingtin-interacting protein 1 [Neophocaena asiaeorientalis asiaeorientalis]|uniref:LOW QUALITY PROTEIN: huntingtin-interacting protein 1 n=1 Tax=Neophocaena asiaeorientalis asiaeorientalis TaxID=1706337 RepID=A0A341BET1_NEOAA|nr:LOW QUALITY PROTEIN: huntingtin-interacting protein 1 [Neophocaena asiaeorientalis asiaeorientalis]
MDRMTSSMKQVPNPLPKVLSRRGVGAGMEAAERESFERTQTRLVSPPLPASSGKPSLLDSPGSSSHFTWPVSLPEWGPLPCLPQSPSATRPLVCLPPSPSQATFSL